MSKEYAFGVIPVRKKEGEWEVLLVKHVKGAYWSFPKGHGNPEEVPHDVARRELFEETGLSVARFLALAPLTETYAFERGVKQVEYYLAEVEGSLTLDSAEVLDAKWLPLEEAINCITYPESKEVCLQAGEVLSS